METSEGTDVSTPVVKTEQITPAKPPVKDIKPVVKDVKPKEEPAKAATPSEKAPASNVVVKKEDVSAPPDPATVVPLVALTVEDKIKMDTSQGLQTEENESLDVHVDDTQNDLDADLFSSEKASQEKKDLSTTDAAKVEEKKEEGKEESGVKEGEAKVESVTPDTEAKEDSSAGKDAKGEKKPADTKEENDTSKPASSSSTAKRSVWFVCPIYMYIILYYLEKSLLYSLHFFSLLCIVYKGWTKGSECLSLHSVVMLRD